MVLTQFNFPPYFYSMNRDHFGLGLVLGLVVPVFGMYLFYLIKFTAEHSGLSDFMFMLKNNHYMISRVISLGLIATIPLITYYKNRKRMQTLKGIFLAIILYALTAVVYRFNLI